jgi:serine/threonine protein kinase/formylglycine-generating enzyme required for sulfatase activity
MDSGYIRQRVTELFEAALLQEPPRRREFLRHACATDEALFAEVNSLVAESERMGDASQPARTARPDRFSTVPRRVGRYIIERELGRGAMGMVFEARDPLIGRAVAVKVIRLDTLGSSAEADWLQERLFREARSAGALSHPGIVVIHDLGRHEDLAYIAMERVDGPTLEQVIATGLRLSTAEVLSILRQTAAALDYAHQSGVVHRDIKPSNLMLHKGVTLKITDFGIAKMTATHQLTKTGVVMGTPSYMSPEQITAKPLDGRADQFSLAVIAFELLAGRKPFQGDTLATLVHQIVYEERPSARSSRPNLPDAVDAVLKRGLSKNAVDRYSSCATFIDAMEGSLGISAAPVRALPPLIVPEVEPARPAVALGTVDEEIPSQEIIETDRSVEVIAEQPQPVAIAATQTLSYPLPDPLPAVSPTRHPSPPTEPPAAISPSFGMLDRSAPRAMGLFKSSWGAGIAVAAALVTVTAVASWVVTHLHRAPAYVIAERGAPVVPAEQTGTPVLAAREQPQKPTPPMPSVNNFGPDRQSIQRGEKVKLTWSVGNATDVRIAPGLGKVGFEGERIVAPSQTTGFTLVARGPGGEVSERTVVQVTDPTPDPAASHVALPRVPLVNTLTASSSSIKEGESAMLEWSVSNASSVRIDPGLGLQPPTGSFRVSPAKTTTYTLTATEEAGEASRSISVQVTPLSPPPFVNMFAASPSSIRAGESALLEWQVPNATGVRVDPGLGARPGNGTLRVFPTETTTYTLVATGAGGEVSRSIVVQVTKPAPVPANVTPDPPPAVFSFSATPSSIRSGESALLEWSVMNATAVRIEPGLGSEQLAGAFRAYPTQTTTYTLVATGAGGEVSRSVIVQVTGPPPAPPPPRSPTGGTTELNPKDGLKYAWIPPGRFTMGCSPGDSECGPEERPAHEVTITKGFWMGQTEVTQAAYQRVTGRNPSTFKGANLPVENVNQTEAQAYCVAAGARLPTDAQWEYAAWGSRTSSRYGPLGDIAWYVDNSGGTPHEVGQKRPNGYGLYDMLGNVAEWITDQAPRRDQSSPTFSLPLVNLVRGGSWGLASAGLRASARSGWWPLSYHSEYIGFRCVRD